jgi:hypothetical protein
MTVAALTALAAGVVGSVGFTLYAGLRVGSPRLLLVLFAGWVVFPFLIFSAGYLLSKRGSAFIRLVYGGSVLAASLASLAAYGTAALGSGRPTTAVFVLVAPLSLLLVAVVVPVVVLSRKRG